MDPWQPTMNIRQRPREYVELPAGELLPHPLNPRTHPETQKAALAGSLQQFGDVRSLLAYRSPQRWPGRVVLIDGHLRQSLDPSRPVRVEVLTDLSDEEAEALLLTIDPLAQLAGYDEANLAELRSRAQADDDTLRAMWLALQANDEAVRSSLHSQEEGEDGQGDPEPRQFKVVIHCNDEQQQVRIFRECKRKGWRAEMKQA
jgi:hypothetical protein